MTTSRISDAREHKPQGKIVLPIGFAAPTAGREVDSATDGLRGESEDSAICSHTGYARALVNVTVLWLVPHTLD